MLDFVLNFLFPPVCVLCRKINKNWICEKCLKKIKRFEKNKKLTKNEFLEKFKCNEKIYFDEFFYCFEYKKIIRKLLLKFKFSGASYISNFFVSIILNNEKLNKILKNYDIIVPVPMDKTKKLIRGYNQTELITNLIKKSTREIIVDNGNIIKVRKTKTQSTLSLRERKENIKNAFIILNPECFKNKNVILFDDICTTGSTVNELSKILKQAKVKNILVLVIAKD